MDIDDHTKETERKSNMRVFIFENFLENFLQNLHKINDNTYNFNFKMNLTFCFDEMDNEIVSYESENGEKTVNKNRRISEISDGLYKIKKKSKRKSKRKSKSKPKSKKMKKSRK